MASNFTAFDLPPLPSYSLKPQPSLIPHVSDAALSLALPVIAYWAVSLFFHIIDTYDLFPQYRLHTPVELLKRNHASRWDVFRDVILQQIIQTIFGLAVAYFDPEPTYGKEEYDVAVWAQRIRMLQRGIPALFGMLGINSGDLGERLGGPSSVLAGALAGGRYPQLSQIVEFGGETVIAPAFASWELQLAKFMYWILVPAIQFFAAVCILDSWQYFLHRGMHMNHYLYTTFHARHHRLYVPYAYGALYNHPVEGFTLDTLGTGVAFLVTGLTVRQCMIFFTFSTIKTVDDHCGYALPWDPLQHLTGNNAAYHDIHHQSWGIKTNFSQPFFTFWDAALGTMWRGGDVRLRYEKARKAADEWWEQQRRKAVNDKQETKTGAIATTTGADVTVPVTEKNHHLHQTSAPSESVMDRAPVLVSQAETPRVRRSPRKGKNSNSVQLKGLKERMVNGGSLPNACSPS